MSKKIEQKPTHNAAIGYTPFPMNHSVKFTSSVGQLLPVLYDRLDPGDVINLSSSIFTRTQPLNSAAFTRITEHIDTFFVPMKLINSFFGDQFYGIQDIGSSVLFFPSETPTSASISSSKKGVVTGLPLCHLQQFYSTIAATRIGLPSGVNNLGAFTCCDEFGVPATYNFMRLCSHLGFGEAVGLSRVHTTNEVTVSHMNNKVNIDFFFAYQKIFSDYYRLSDYTPNNPLSYSADRYICYVSTQGVSSTWAFPAFLSYSKSVPSGMFTETSYEWYNPNSPFCLRYRPWKKDYFTNLYPTPLIDLLDSQNPYADLNEPNGEHGGMLNTKDPYLSPASFWYNDEYFPKAEVPVYADGYNTYYGGDYNAITPSVLRVLKAWEKMSAITQRAGKHYNDQTKAHYGVSVPQGISDEVYYLGSHHSRLQIGEVLSTATTGSGSDTDSYSVLGEIGGRGISSGTQGKNIHFKAPCHGILMSIFSAVPESDYPAWGIDDLNLYTSITRYYHPEFDNLGMVPLDMIVYDSRQFDQHTPNAEVNEDNHPFSYILGWRYRYSELKSKYDTIHGAFLYTLKNWVTPRDTSLFSSVDDETGVSNLMKNSPLVQKYFYISPHTLNPILALDFLHVETYKNGDYTYKYVPFFEKLNWNRRGYSHSYYSGYDVYKNDPLIHNIDFFYKKVSKKSLYGLPNI